MNLSRDRGEYEAENGQEQFEGEKRYSSLEDHKAIKNYLNYSDNPDPAKHRTSTQQKGEIDQAEKELNLYDVQALLHDAKNGSVNYSKIAKMKPQMYPLSVNEPIPKFPISSKHSTKLKRRNIHRLQKIYSPNLQKNRHNLTNNYQGNMKIVYDYSSFQKKMEDLTSLNSSDVQSFQPKSKKIRVKTEQSNGKMRPTRTLFKRKNSVTSDSRNKIYSRGFHKVMSPHKQQITLEKNLKLQKVLSQDTKKRLNLITEKQFSKHNHTRYKTKSTLKSGDKSKLTTNVKESATNPLKSGIQETSKGLGLGFGSTNYSGYLKKTVKSNELLKTHLNMQVKHPEDFLPVKEILSPYQTFSNLKLSNNNNKLKPDGKTTPLFYKKSHKSITRKSITPGILYTSSIKIPNQTKLNLPGKGSYHEEQLNSRQKMQLRKQKEIEELRKRVREMSALSVNRGKAIKVYSTFG